MYYVKWILTYKKFILKGKAIEEGGYDIPYRTIRKYYKNNELKKDNE